MSCDCVLHPDGDSSFGSILIFFNKFTLRKVWRFQKLAVTLHHTNDPHTSDTNKQTPNSTPHQSTLHAMKDTTPPTAPTATNLQQYVHHRPSRCKRTLIGIVSKNISTFATIMRLRKRANIVTRNN